LCSLLWNPNRPRVGIPKGYRLFRPSWSNHGLNNNNHLIIIIRVALIVPSSWRCVTVVLCMHIM
jgi:hypothetical protein